MKLLVVNIISKIVKSGHGHVNGGAIIATRLVIIDKSLNDIICVVVAGHLLVASVSHVTVHLVHEMQWRSLLWWYIIRIVCNYALL